MTSPIKFDQTSIGSVGSLVGAALESAGHYLQSAVLDLFASGLAESLGALLYIISAVFAIFLIAVGGNYKHGAWFLLGPAFFYFLIAVRVDSTGPEWNFGGLERDNTQLGEALRGVSERGNTSLRTSEDAARVYEIEQTAAIEFGKKARVSWFFARWNKLSSEIVNNFIAVVNQSNKYRDVQFISKVDRYARVINAKTEDQELIQFFHSLVITKCSRLYSLKMDLYNSGISEPRRVVIQKELEKGLDGKLNQKVVNLTVEENHADTLDYLREYFFDADSSSSLNSRYSQIFNSGEFPITNRELYSGNFSCGQLWQLSMILFKDNADLLIPAIFAEGLVDDLPANEARNALLNQFRKESQCSQYDDKEQSECPANYNPEQADVLEPLRHPGTISSDEMAYNTMLNEMAGRMILDELKNVSSDIIGHELDERVLEKDKFNEWQKSGTSSLVRDLHGGIEFLGKGDFLTSMLSMPYMQGLALYFLALVFPFFALVVLIPGRQNGFFLWMGLWFWIKSWDFGFAVVMMISDMLYVLLPQGPALTDGDLSSPDIVMKKLLEVDPSYSVYLYYRLIATCLAAVPLLTGVLVQRGGGEIMKAIEQGFKDFGGRIGHSMDQMERAILAGDQAARARIHMVNGINNEAKKILDNNNELRNTVAKALGAQAVASLMQSGGGLDAAGLAQKLAAASNQANATRALKTANAIYRAELSMKAFELSNDHYTVSKSARAVALGMFMRHPGRFVPMDDLLNVMLESVNPNVGNSFEKIAKDQSFTAAGALSVGKKKFEEFLSKGEDNQSSSSGQGSNSYMNQILGNSSQIDGLGEGSKNSKPVWSLESAIREENLLYNQNSDKEEILNSGHSYRAGGHDPGSQRFDGLRPGTQVGRPIESDFEIGNHRHHGAQVVTNEDGQVIPAVNSEKLEPLKENAAKHAYVAGMNEEEIVLYLSMIEHRSGWNPSYGDSNSDGAGLFNESVSNMTHNYQRLVDAGQIEGITQENLDRGEYPNRFNADNALRSNALKIVGYRDQVNALVENDFNQLNNAQKQNFDRFEQKLRYYYAFATEEAPNTFDQGGAQAEVTNHILPLARQYQQEIRTQANQAQREDEDE